MAALRRNLHVFATIWLGFQVAWLVAIVPRDCCAAHRPAEHDGAPCPMHHRAGHEGHQAVEAEHHHEAAPPEHHHQAAAAAHHHETVTPGHHHETTPAEHHHQPSSRSPLTDCQLTGGCDGPMATFFALLSNHGVLPEPASALTQVGIRLAGVSVRENVIGRFTPPDSPPPRA